MAGKYLKPMLDTGSSRVFNCNALTRKVLAADPGAQLFFRNPPLNGVVLIKDASAEAARSGARGSVGTKLYFPFNEHNIYDGGRTIFLHDVHVRQAITDNFGQKASVTNEAMAEDLRVLELLDGLPSLDPFLMKDAFQRAQFAANEAYFEISPEFWSEIESFILQRFEPLVSAAFPDAMASDEKARRLVEKIWEASDVNELAPLIEAFRLPADQALDIFKAWKGINFYSFQHVRVQPQLIDMTKWLNGIVIPHGAMTTEQRTKLVATAEAVRDELRREWQKIEVVLREYADGYDKMFKTKEGSAQFLGFLRNCSKAYWDLGNGLGKVNHAAYCWRLMIGRSRLAKLPWPLMQQTLQLLAEVLAPEKKSANVAAWA
jgi:hypothetical protein